MHCEEAADRAQVLYTQGNFAETIAALETCSERPNLPLELFRRTHRLLILSHLRLDDEPRARATAESLVLADPQYRPNPILDPPDFVAFVENVRSNRATAVQVVDVADRADSVFVAPADDLSGLPFSISGYIGASSYGGERGERRSSPWSQLAANSGIGLGLEILRPLTRDVQIGGSLDLHYLPARFFLDFAPPEPIDQDASSAWSAVLMGTAAWYYHDLGFASPGVALGAGAVFSYLNDKVRAGAVLQPGLRILVPVDSRWSVEGRSAVAVTMPGRALDLRDVSSLRPEKRQYDLVTQTGVAVVYRFRQ